MPTGELFSKLSRVGIVRTNPIGVVSVRRRTGGVVRPQRLHGPRGAPTDGGARPPPADRQVVRNAARPGKAPAASRLPSALGPSAGTCGLSRDTHPKPVPMA